MQSGTHGDEIPRGTDTVFGLLAGKRQHVHQLQRRYGDNVWGLACRRNWRWRQSEIAVWSTEPSEALGSPCKQAACVRAANRAKA
jgi:hypothetical protein